LYRSRRRTCNIRSYNRSSHVEGYTKGDVEGYIECTLRGEERLGEGMLCIEMGEVHLKEEEAELVIEVTTQRVTTF
jgi:hypothetical protein